MQRYSYQLIIILFSLLSLAAVLAEHPIIEDSDLIDFVVEALTAIICLFFMFWVERLNLKASNHVYKLLLASSTFLYFGHLMDAIDEITVDLLVVDFLEDLLQPSGFLLFMLANFKWVQYHQQQSSMMKKLATTDPLTGVLNRRAFHDIGTALVNKFRNSKHELSIIIIDIDHFKLVNDRFGHQVGDCVLIEMTTKIRSLLRKNDYIARFGGEEFVVLLYDTNLEETKVVAEKIRSCVESLTVSVDKKEVRFTISLGVAVAVGYVHDGIVESLIGLADNALYKAKEQGRNRLIVSNETASV